LLLVVAVGTLCVAQDLTPAQLVSNLLVGLINDQKLLPKSISVDQTISGVTIKSVDFSSNPTVQTLNVTNLAHASLDNFVLSSTAAVLFPSVKLATSLGNVDIGSTVLSFNLQQGTLSIPCSGSGQSALTSLLVTDVNLANPSTDWIIKLVVNVINKTPIPGPLISKAIPLPINFDVPQQVAVLCIMPLDNTRFVSLASADMTPSDFLVAVLNSVIKNQANSPIEVSGCKGTLNQINLCDTATKTAESDKGAIIPCEAGCNTAYGACVAGTNVCYGPCWAACKVLPWCHSSDCDSKCGRDKCGSVKDSCISDCYRALTWHGGAGLDSVSGVGSSLTVTQVSVDSATGTWLAQFKVSPSARLKFMCDPVVPSWQYVSSGLGDWTVTLKFVLKCDASKKISGFGFTDYSLTGFDVKVISGVFNTFHNVPGFAQLMGYLNGVVQDAIYGAVSSTIRDTLENGMQGLCPIDTQGISLC